MALSNRQKKRAFEGIRVGLILIAAAVMMVPILWISMAAFKTHVDVYQLKVFFTPTFENFETVFQSPYWRPWRPTASRASACAASASCSS